MVIQWSRMRNWNMTVATWTSRWLNATSESPSEFTQLWKVASSLSAPLWLVEDLVTWSHFHSWACFWLCHWACRSHCQTPTSVLQKNERYIPIPCSFGAEASDSLSCFISPKRYPSQFLLSEHRHFASICPVQYVSFDIVLCELWYFRGVIHWKAPWLSTWRLQKLQSHSIFVGYNLAAQLNHLCVINISVSISIQQSLNSIFSKAPGYLTGILFTSSENRWFLEGLVQ